MKGKAHPPPFVIAAEPHDFPDEASMPLWDFLYWQAPVARDRGDGWNKVKEFHVGLSRPLADNDRPPAAPGWGSNHPERGTVARAPD